MSKQFTIKLGEPVACSEHGDIGIIYTDSQIGAVTGLVAMLMHLHEAHGMSLDGMTRVLTAMRTDPDAIARIRAAGR